MTRDKGEKWRKATVRGLLIEKKKTTRMNFWGIQKGRSARAKTLARARQRVAPRAGQREKRKSFIRTRREKRFDHKTASWGVGGPCQPAGEKRGSEKKKRIRSAFGDWVDGRTGKTTSKDEGGGVTGSPLENRRKKEGGRAIDRDARSKPASRPSGKESLESVGRLQKKGRSRRVGAGDTPPRRKRTDRGDANLKRAPTRGS